jgi:hypothetical protein
MMDHGSRYGSMLEAEAEAVSARRRSRSNIKAEAGREDGGDVRLRLG